MVAESQQRCWTKERNVVRDWQPLAWDSLLVAAQLGKAPTRGGGREWADCCAVWPATQNLRTFCFFWGPAKPSQVPGQ